MHANAERQIVVPRAKEAGRAPDGVNDNGVDESRDHEAVAQIRLELKPLGDRSGDDGRGRGGERELEEPSDQARGVIDADEEEVLVADESLLVAARAPKAKA